MTEPEVTPGGSRVIRHGERRSPESKTSERSTLENIRKREAAYTAIFGPPALTYDDAHPVLVPHIDVYVHEPGFQGRDFYTLVTGGMSDFRMKLPEDAPPEMPTRIELIFYLPGDRSPKREYIDFLRTAARMPYDYQTWFAWGASIVNGNPPKPIFDGSQFDSLLFINTPIAEPDNTLSERLVLEGDAVHFLWTVPLTAAEREYKLEEGTEALLEVFDEVQHPFVFDENRPSYIEWEDED